MNCLRGVGMVCVTAFSALLLLWRPSAANDTVGADLSTLAAQAMSDETMTARDAAAKLRAAGPAGLAALLSANADTIQHRATPSTSNMDPAWRRLCCTIDAVAAQHDAYTSGLYWYTDFNAAKAAARAQNKPILSLRLLGKLNEEFSCANSRFFRTALYANAEVSKALRERFILHWQSVRPVPRITIDFGDGRKVERTITGNSIHYVLSPDGEVIDAIPGLYGPTAFLRELNLAQSAASMYAASPVGQSQDTLLRQWHARQQQRIVEQWQRELRQVGATASRSDAPLMLNDAVALPPAIAAAPLAITKSGIEIKIVRELTPSAIAFAQSLESGTDDATWAKVAALHRDDSKLDDGSRALIAAKFPGAAQAAVITASKGRVENPLVRIVGNFERSIAEDTVRNEYVFHRKIHEWLADANNSSLTTDVNALNERVYAELFLTPSSDPWLGLVPADTYSALEGDGIHQ